MLETIQCAILEIGRSFFLTLSNLSADDIVNIWANVSAFVDRHMSLQKGVRISGLGTFTFSQQRLDVGHRFILIQRPVFVMSEKLLQIHGLSRAKQHVSDDIPIVELNFTFLALESPFDRDTVEGCVKETLLIMNRYIAFNRDVNFTFKDIGVLTIRNNKVKMKFYREFLNAMDGSGNLVNALSNRPGTADSVKSIKDVCSVRPATASSVLFPRIQSVDINERKSVIPTIKEENEPENDENPCNIQNSELSKENEQTEKLKESEKSRETTEMPLVKQPTIRQPLVPTKISSVGTKEDFQKNVEPKDLSESFRWASPHRSLSCQSAIQSTNVQTVKIKTPPATVCSDHCRAGQELCYLCMQRALKNFPIDISESRRRKELEEEQLLQQYQQMKNQEAIFHEQCEMLAGREYNQKISAFNIGVAEAKKRRKNSKCKDVNNGYIFQRRLLTPPVILKQQQYAQCLKKQMEEKQQRQNRKKQDEDFLDRLEQVQLAEDLAIQREMYLKEKQGQKEAYKTALDIQKKEKPRQLPAFVPDSSGPIFGCSELPGKSEEQKQAARKLCKEQMQAAADHKRDAILNQIYEQKTELEMLERSRKGHPYSLQPLHTNKYLEDQWCGSAGLKRSSATWQLSSQSHF
ncbi:coiled-coil domain-containing protein 81-like isoform X2 [Hemitrygon akajei]|uniref:coiled-coil domain-containing protein 81-like isoform X2 n=1 Tax=Hemitrygon akajei TaxID=2704970 RepID=UPI003BF9C2A8